MSMKYRQLHTGNRDPVSILLPACISFIKIGKMREQLYGSAIRLWGVFL
jgi:hypothetical protein